MDATLYPVVGRSREMEVSPADARDFTLGDYDLVVTTPGDNRCAPGRSR
ncbi:MAG: hypothetical protein ACMG6S_17830 [Byssovorax sp.]